VADDAPIIEVHGELSDAAIDALAAMLLALVEHEAAEPAQEAA
jgi:hypothetical protein